MEKGSQVMARGTNRTHYRPQRNVRFVDLGETIQMLRLAVVRNQLMF
jgi:hypothetical protein